MDSVSPQLRPRPFRIGRFTKKVVKRIVPLGLALYFIPILFACSFACGLADVLRNRPWSFSTIQRYFVGNGFFTWMLAPFNLLMDLLSFPYRNRGVYALGDLPKGHQAEINALIEAAVARDLVGELEAKMAGKRRGMIFFKWYGKNVETSVHIPEFHRPYRYIRTIGVSIFNKKQSTGKHFGPLRVTLRVLYNVNTIDDRNVYIQVGDHTHHWQDNKLFIFDDTLQHQSCNESDAVRYCLFVDILRPGLLTVVTSTILSCLRVLISRFNFVFYQHWTFIK